MPPLLHGFIEEMLTKYYGDCMPLPVMCTQAQTASVLASRHPCLIFGSLKADTALSADRTPTAAAIISQLRSHSDSLFPARFDHLAFRTFGVRGIACIAAPLGNAP